MSVLQKVIDFNEHLLSLSFPGLNAWKRTGTEQGGMFICCSLCRSERA